MSIDMIGSVSSRSGMSKEEARIQLKRESMEKRKEKLLNPRARVIGLDVDALDAQVAEVQKSRANMKQQDLIDRMRLQEIDRVLEQHAEEERQQKAYHIQSLKSSWEEATSLKKSLQSKQAPIDLERVGISAAQVFDGEDRTKDQRITAQKEQMRRWIQEQVAEKAYNRDADREEADTYANFLRSVDEIRASAEMEEKELKASIKADVNWHNSELIKARRERDAKENEFKSRPVEEQLKALSLDLFDENPELSMSEEGRIVRTDMFKGYTTAQARRIFQENEQVIQQKREKEEHERQLENEWAMQQKLLGRALEQQQAQLAAEKEAEKARHLAILKEQSKAEAERRVLSNKAKYGAIEAGFFENFGTGCR